MAATGTAGYAGGHATAAASGAGGLTTNVAALLCYSLGLITGVLFLVLEPYNRNRFIRFHAWQSTFFAATMFLLYIAEGILSFILPFFLITMIWFAVFFGGIAVWIYLMIKAYYGDKFKLPVIGDLAEKQAA